MKLINTINLNLRTISAVVNLLLRWISEHKARPIIESLILLEMDYFKRITYPQLLNTKYEKLFLLKFATIWLLTLAGLYVVYRYVDDTFPWWLATMLFTMIIINLNHGILLHYFMCLLYIISRCFIITHRLKGIYKTLVKTATGLSQRSSRLLQKVLAVEVECMTGVHFKLGNLVAELNDCYQYHLLINLITHVFNNIAMGYYDIILSHNSKKFNLTYYDYILGGVTYCGLILDLYLIDVGCSILEDSQFDTAAALKKFNQLFNMQADLNKSVSYLFNAPQQTLNT